MSPGDVLRYAFEAAVLNAPKRLRRTSGLVDPLDSMMVVRTGKWLLPLIKGIYADNNPGLVKAEVLRRLLESMLKVADNAGMAHVMKLRENALGRR